MAEHPAPAARQFLRAAIDPHARPMFRQAGEHYTMLLVAAAAEDLVDAHRTPGALTPDDALDHLMDTVDLLRRCRPDLTTPTPGAPPA